MRRFESAFVSILWLSLFCPVTSSRAVDVASTILSYNPVAFYKLDETANPGVKPPAVDSSTNGYHGFYLPNAQDAYNGISGPQGAGFPANSGAAKTTFNVTNAYVVLPGLPIYGTNLTIMAWINPNPWSQQKGAGIVFNSRDAGGGSGTNASGFGFAQSGTARNGIYPLYGMWGNKNWTWNNSGVYPPISGPWRQRSSRRPTLRCT